MTGREEHQIQTEEKLQQYIKSYPAYGTRLYKATHDIHYVQEMMNHASPNTTQIYIVDEDQTEMNQKANDIMEGLCV